MICFVTADASGAALGSVCSVSRGAEQLLQCGSSSAVLMLSCRLGAAAPVQPLPLLVFFKK